MAENVDADDTDDADGHGGETIDQPQGVTELTADEIISALTEPDAGDEANGDAGNFVFNRDQS